MRVGREAKLLAEASPLSDEPVAVEFDFARRPSAGDVVKMAKAICSAWPKPPDGCAALCMQRLGGIPPDGCPWAAEVHGKHALVIMMMK